MRACPNPGKPHSVRGGRDSLRAVPGVGVPHDPVKVTGRMRELAATLTREADRLDPG